MFTSKLTKNQLEKTQYCTYWHSSSVIFEASLHPKNLPWQNTQILIGNTKRSELLSIHFSQDRTTKIYTSDIYGGKRLYHGIMHGDRCP